MRKTLNILFALLILTVSVLPVLINTENAYADTSDLPIASAGTYSTGTYVGGATNYTNLNSDDDDTSYIRWYIKDIDGNRYQTYNFDNFVESYDAINSVTLYIKAKRDIASIGYVPVCRYSGTNYLGTAQAVGVGGYSTVSYTWTTNPATGLAWSATEINAAEFGWYVYSINGIYYYTYTTYSYLRVTYTAYTLPTVSSVAADNITYTGAVHWADLNGTIDNLGGFASCSDRGFVWDTSSHNLVSENVTPAASGYTNSFADTGTFTTGAFDNTIGGLVAGTTYYYRAFAKNTLSYDYGSELTFETLYTPSISISPATAISTTTAQINAIVADDGNQSCDVRFGYGITTQAAVVAYDNQTAWITDVYDIGESAYAELSALNSATTYYYRAEIKNDIGSSESNELNFTTVNAVNEPVSIIAIPYGTSLSLTWVKGSGASYTLIRYSTGSYPATTSSGTLAYLGTGESVVVEDLTPGITYYISAWGKGAATYSTGYETALATTLAYDTGIQDIDNIETPESNSDFLLTPSETNVQNIPLVGGLVQGVSTSYGTPVNMIWYVGWVLIGIALYVIVYNRFGFNLIATMTVEIFWFAIGSTLGLTMLWIVVILLIVSGGFIAFGERR